MYIKHTFVDSHASADTSSLRPPAGLQPSRRASRPAFEAPRHSIVATAGSNSRSRQTDAEKNIASTGYGFAISHTPHTPQQGAITPTQAVRPGASITSTENPPPSFPGIDEDGHISYKLGDGLEPGITQPKGRFVAFRQNNHHAV
jgi:hypothetical protein